MRGNGFICFDRGDGNDDTGAMKSVPAIRIRTSNSAPVRRERDFVLYWMIGARRTSWNFAFDRAIEWSQKLRKPLVVLEALRCDYRWASDRMHRFVLDGMVENDVRLDGTGVLYYPYVEPAGDAGKGLLKALASRACMVVTDEFPCFFLPRMVMAAARQTDVLLEAVDSNGLLPLAAADRTFPTAYAFRRFLQKELPQHLMEMPAANPLGKARLPHAKALARKITERWPKSSIRDLETSASLLPGIPIDHKVAPVAIRGGSKAAQGVLRNFVRKKLTAYAEARNEPAECATSGLSPYLHFGHISAHQIFSEVMRHEEWSQSHLALRSTGSRAGWWGIRPTAEGFLDQLITWREVGFNFCHTRQDYDRFNSLPAWALKTLRAHRRDERSDVYTLEEFERADTHDSLWNAAQMQLIREGRIHNYLRMLWGKKILEWTLTPDKALEVMVELNNKYAIDGRDPNSYSGIYWCLGRYDRPWGPERPVFGTVRYMSSANTARKLHVKEYLREYGNTSSK
jgi:deoxyribodipyrimidine photo-lyase